MKAHKNHYMNDKHKQEMLQHRRHTHISVEAVHSMLQQTQMHHATMLDQVSQDRCVQLCWYSV